MRCDGCIANAIAEAKSPLKAMHHCSVIPSADVKTTCNIRYTRAKVFPRCTFFLERNDTHENSIPL